MYNSMDNELHDTNVMPRDLSFQLLEDTTNGFSEERKLGSGGYGVVYKGVLKNGEEIAVKKLHNMPGLDDKQFENELKNLSSLRHQNIVRLIGYCREERDKCVKYNGQLVFAKMIDRVICLEYLHNGSLEKHLSDESSGLDWSTRYNIIKGICKGLKYLHEGGKYPIYHLDLKPSNILLDENMVPKIADFGLSRLFNETRQSHITNNIIGSIGYMPPEYIEKRQISKKFDVFSLGVIIIQIMTGPMGYFKSAEISSQKFIDLVYENWRKRLQQSWSYTSLEVYSHQVKGCIEIALNCVEVERHKRPTIGNIIDTLKEIKDVTNKVSMPFSHELKNDASSSATQQSIRTTVLRVFMHCNECMKKVNRVLCSIEGVYMTTLDQRQHKVTVEGIVDPDTLIRLLYKSGKQAVLWPTPAAGAEIKKFEEVAAAPPPAGAAATATSAGESAKDAGKTISF